MYEEEKCAGASSLSKFRDFFFISKRSMLVFTSVLKPAFFVGYIRYDDDASGGKKQIRKKTAAGKSNNFYPILTKLNNS